MALLAAIAKKQNRAVLAVTHDPRTIPYADRIVEIEDGCIVGQHKRKVLLHGPVIRNNQGEIRHNYRRKRKADA